MKKLQILAVSLGVVLGGFVALASAANIVLDDFTLNTTHSAMLNCTVGGTCPGVATSTQTGIPTANTIGGSRALTLTIAAGSNFDSLTANIITNALSLNLGSGDNGTGSVLYDASGAGLNVNLLTLGGGNPNSVFFQSLVPLNDLGLVFTAQITDTAANGSDTATFTTTLGAGVGFVNQALSSFTNAGAVNFAAISNVRVSLDGPGAQDATISFFEVTDAPIGAVPEPGSILLLLTGVVGLGGYGWYRRQGKSVA